MRSSEVCTTKTTSALKSDNQKSRPINDESANISIKKIKPIKADPHDIHSDNYAEEYPRDDLSYFVILRRKELIVHHKEYAGQTEEKDGVIIHRFGKVEPQSRKMRARHAAKGTADAEYSISRADASEIPRQKIKNYNDSRSRPRVLEHYYDEFLHRIFLHPAAPFLML